MIQLTHQAFQLLAIAFVTKLLLAGLRVGLKDPKLTALEEKVKDLKKKLMKALKEGDQKKVEKLTKSFHSLYFEILRRSFVSPANLASILVFFFVFVGLSVVYKKGEVVALLFGYHLDWVGWFILCFLILSLIFAAAVKVVGRASP